MKKKIIATMLTLALLVSIFPSSAFAYDNSVEDYHNDTDINSVLEIAVEENVDVVENVNETKDDFEVTAEDISIITPKDGGETIDTVLEDGDVIGLSFPSEVDTGKGEIENGTVAYSTDEDVDVYSQVEAEQVEGETLLFNRM
ncbi:MAG: hypothetical protein Q4F96_05380, partial [Bacillota bacterium]|nr:hypothetical protein [Bacillota bacterium]